jgi:hypothetical protein
MFVDRNGTTVIDAKYTLDLEYESDETTGKLLVGIWEVATASLRETRLGLSPWSHGGYVVVPWSAASSVFIAGADRIVLLSLSDASVLCSVLYELEEYATEPEPTIVISDDICLVASHLRVTCIDQRKAIRWSWSVSTPPMSRWAALSGPPVVVGDDVRVPIRTGAKDFEIVLAVVDGARRLNSEAYQ